MWWLWFNWQSGHFRHQRPKVQNNSLAKFSVSCIEKKKRPGMVHFENHILQCPFNAKIQCFLKHIHLEEDNSDLKLEKVSRKKENQSQELDFPIFRDKSLKNINHTFHIWTTLRCPSMGHYFRYLGTKSARQPLKWVNKMPSEILLENQFVQKL